MSEEIKNTSTEYSADSIQVLEGLEAVRKKAIHVYWRYQRERSPSLSV